MQISTYQAVRLGMVRDRNNKLLVDLDKYKDKSSFDINIREVIIKNDQSGDVERKNGVAILQPQDSAYLVSEEIINVPKGYIAYVFLKNRMSQKGLLALNTGIIDQDYHGPISTLVINLSGEATSIPDLSDSDGKAFFRIVFHKVSASDSLPKPHYILKSPRDYEKYCCWRKKELEKLPRTFLDSEAVKKQVANELNEKAFSLSIGRLGLTVALVGLLLGIGNFTKDYFIGKSFGIENYINDKAKLQAKTESLEGELKNLKLELERMKKSSFRDEIKLTIGVQEELKKLKNELTELQSEPVYIKDKKNAS